MVSGVTDFGETFQRFCENIIAMLTWKHQLGKTSCLSDGLYKLVFVSTWSADRGSSLEPVVKNSGATGTSGSGLHRKLPRSPHTRQMRDI